jgi:diguanylate cyclase (GGDEF)-like protein/PAS domain S-box-containing protein
MSWVLTPSSAILFTTTALSLVVAGFAWNRRELPGGALLSFLLFAVAEWSLVAGLEASFSELAWKILFSKLEYVGSGSVSVLFLLFAARYSGRDGWLRRRWRFLVWIPPILALTLVATNELHHSVWTAFLPGPAGSNSVIYVHGIGFYAIIAEIYLFVLAGSALLLLSAIRPIVLRRRQIATVLGGSLFPITAGILYTLGDSVVRGLNLVPVSFLFTGLVFVISMGVLRIFDLVPVARDALVEEMSDAILVLDSSERIVDMNPAAGSLLGLGPSSVGKQVGEALPIWVDLVKRVDCTAESHIELALEEEPLRYVDVRVSPLRSPTRLKSGCLIVFRDITQRHDAEMSLQLANRRLEDHVERIEALQLRLQEQAIRDSLTSLFNRRYLDEVFPRELERAEQAGKPLCVILFDIDHFKKTNDRFGHEEGDRLLSALGSILRSRTRPRDVACRYGGEEFLVILPETELEAAKARCREIRRAFTDLMHEATGEEAASLSAGIAVFPEHGRTQDALIRSADEALYAAKNAGRDRMRIAAASPSQPLR